MSLRRDLIFLKRLRVEIFGKGIGGTRDPEKALDWNLKAAVAGHCRARLLVSFQYRLEKSPPDYARSLMWHILSTEERKFHAGAGKK